MKKPKKKKPRKHRVVQLVVEGGRKTATEHEGQGARRTRANAKIVKEKVGNTGNN